MTPVTSTVSGTERLLTVTVGGQSLALPGHEVVEVSRRPRITRVPHGPPALVGVSNLRGTVLPIVSLARLMGGEPGGEQRVVVLDHAGPVGLLVDAVLHLDTGEKASAGRRMDVAALLDAGFQRQAAPAQSSQTPGGAAPAVSQTGQAQRALVSFLVSGQTFALPLGVVVEVLRLPDDVSRVTGADAAVLGVADVRDRSLPILSLAALLGLAVQANVAGSPLLVVDHDGARLGLVADRIEAILRLDESAIDKVPPILQRGRGEAELDAIGRQAGGRSLVSILSVPGLFARAAVKALVTTTSNEATVVDHTITESLEQFVVFALGEERYGLPIAAVQEVLRVPETITRLPNGPRFVTGLINLRGRPVPIIDQRQRFDAPAATSTMQPRVIIVTVAGLQAGIVVDAVSEVLSVAADRLAPTPSLSSERSAVFNRVAHLGSDGALVLLIDPAELLSRAEQDVIADIAARQTGADPT